jgi:hypothetical protein
MNFDSTRFLGFPMPNASLYEGGNKLIQIYNTCWLLFLKVKEALVLKNYP